MSGHVSETGWPQPHTGYYRLVLRIGYIVLFGIAVPIEYQPDHRTTGQLARADHAPWWLPFYCRVAPTDHQNLSILECLNLL